MAPSGVKLFFTGELFAQAPVDQYPGCVVEAVTDSSRYFVIRIEDGNGKALWHFPKDIFNVKLNQLKKKKTLFKCKFRNV